MSESNSNITVERRELTAAIGAGEDEDLELLGRAMIYGVGEVLVPRDWLLQRCRDLDVPERIVPTEPRPHSAYKRAQSRLVTSNTQNGKTRTDVRYASFPGFQEPFRVELDSKDGNGNVNHLTADVFFPAEVTGEEGGKWVHHDLGHFNYDTETQSTVAVKHDDCPEALEDLWAEMEKRARDLHQRMMEHHTGDDLRHMIYLEMILNSPPDWPSLIPLRDAGAVYFVPEGDLTEVLESLATIFSEVNTQFKQGGKDVEIRTLEIVDTDEKREWIEGRVEQSLEKLVDDVIDDAFEALEDGDDTVDDIVETVAEQLGEGGDTAAQYNGLLQAKLDVEAMMANRAQEVEDDEKEELIENAMEAVDL